MINRNTFFVTLILSLLILCSPNSVMGKKYNNDGVEKELLAFIQQIESKKGYRFLYSEALVTGYKTSLNINDEDLFDKLNDRFKNESIRFLVNEELKQVIIFRQRDEISSTYEVSGFILDAESGSILPYATLSWSINDKTRGVVTNSEGYFNASLKKIRNSDIWITASYLGYEKRKILINENSFDGDNLYIRLKPNIKIDSEVLILGNFIYGMSDQIQQTVSLNRGQILGESNTITALQSIPSVNITTAMNNGLHVRGSPADGFMVLLDDMVVYNQSHLFGLFDNFNPSAISTNGVFYDVTPAYIPAPIGGALSLQTKKGSLNKHNFDAALSNTSIQATANGPLKRGKSAYLLSLKSSTINQMPWLGNSNLVNWGLDVDRDKKTINDLDNAINLNPIITQNLKSNASFIDLHSSLYRKWRNGSELTAAIYYGFDNTNTQYERAFREFSLEEENRIQFQPALTEQQWDNFKGSLKFHSPLSKQLTSTSSVGFSMFESNFQKDDFTYTQIEPQNNSLQSFTSALRMKSIVNDIQFKQDLSWLFKNQRIILGTSHQLYKTEYFEDSFERLGLLISENALRSDAYLSTDLQFKNRLYIEAGLRYSHFSNGNYHLWMPRLKWRLDLLQSLQIGAGYSINYQLLNRLRFSNILSADVWVLANESQPPTSSENLSAGIYFPFSKNHFVQIEAFYRNYNNLRLHEIDTYSISNSFDSISWFSDNSGEGRGLEVFISNTFGPLSISNAYTFSRTTYQNEFINDGSPYAVDWDRTHQYNGHIELSVTPDIRFIYSQTIASGTPNKLATFGREGDDRLDNYIRSDLRFSVLRKWNDNSINMSVSFYNLLNRRNPWYRELGFAINQDDSNSDFIRTPIEVYDLGFQPSFSLRIDFN